MQTPAGLPGPSMRQGSAAMGGLLREFRAFALRGNALDLAIGVVLALAFSGVVDALVDGVLMNFIAAIFGQPNFDALTFSVGDGVIEYGKLLTALVNFVIVAGVLFGMVKAMSAAGLFKMRAQGTTECIYCKSEIPVDATKCSSCGSDVEPVLIDE